MNNSHAFFTRLYLRNKLVVLQGSSQQVGGIAGIFATSWWYCRDLRNKLVVLQGSSQQVGGIAGIQWSDTSAVVTSRNHLITKMDRYNDTERERERAVHSIPTHALHTQQGMANIVRWVTTKPTISLLTYSLTYPLTCSTEFVRLHLRKKKSETCGSVKKRVVVSILDWFCAIFFCLSFNLLPIDIMLEIIADSTRSNGVFYMFIAAPENITTDHHEVTAGKSCSVTRWRHANLTSVMRVVDTWSKTCMKRGESNGREATRVQRAIWNPDVRKRNTDR